MKKSDFEAVLYQHIRLKIYGRWYDGTIQEINDRCIKFYTGRVVKKPLFKEVEDMEIITASMVW